MVQAPASDPSRGATCSPPPGSLHSKLQAPPATEPRRHLKPAAWASHKFGCDPPPPAAISSQVSA
ncbi:hypothetical protein [Nannocystis sp.]|uniref:hypothetical protein n=1 Tax=Nannocystis sp. TaxID=1962667 RepID=UPI0024227467|nr:hypothetical protein [Nannocystis sp.]MBK7824866.1 hypothetical protein [Nannocystis sp.]MBK9752879.1 hypothetical protein [Nannocystis sp.]